MNRWSYSQDTCSFITKAHKVACKLVPNVNVKQYQKKTNYQVEERGIKSQDTDLVKFTSKVQQ